MGNKKSNKKQLIETSQESTTLSKKKINGAKKGKQFERDVANAIGHIFPEAQRMLEYQASVVIGVDLQGTGRFKIQCKNYQGYAPIGKISEIRALEEGDIPVLISKGNKLPAMAVLPFKDFIELLEEIYLNRKPLIENKQTLTVEAEVVNVIENKMEEADTTLSDFI